MRASNKKFIDEVCCKYDRDEKQPIKDTFVTGWECKIVYGEWKHKQHFKNKLAGKR